VCDKCHNKISKLKGDDESNKQKDDDNDSDESEQCHDHCNAIFKWKSAVNWCLKKKKKKKTLTESKYPVP
jgi:hypothetical protein